jgi:hypothetical protein
VYILPQKKGVHYGNNKSVEFQKSIEWTN